MKKKCEKMDCSSFGNSSNSISDRLAAAVQTHRKQHQTAAKPLL